METSKDTEKRGRLLTFVFVFLAACLCNLQAYSLDIMGPPVAELQQGTFDAGIEFTNSKMDLDLINGFYSDFLDGAWLESGEAFDVTLKDLKINQTNTKFGYGITDNVEVYLLIGGLNARFGDSIWEASEKFDSGTELAGGAGVKVTFFEEKGFKLGGLAQFNISSFDGQLKSPYWPASDFVEMDLSEVQLAVGASCQCNEHLMVYGGPFLHLASGGFSDVITEFDPNGLFTSEFNWDIKQKSVLGGYIGVQFSFAQNSSLNLEYQQTADARAFGMGLLFKF